MARTWLSIRVDLVEGRGERQWPRPGRLFAASRSHTFAQLARAIDDTFARWDLAHLHEFKLTDGMRLTTPYDDWEELDGSVDDRKVRLSRLALGHQFTYVFDLGDHWAHLCTVGPERVDPLEMLGIVPAQPLPYFGWGMISISTGDAGTRTMASPDHPRYPKGVDLPPLRRGWGPRDSGGPLETFGTLEWDSGFDFKAERSRRGHD